MPNLDDRMKRYEQSVGSILVPRLPAILRIDGRAFHSFTKGMKRPYDANFHKWMQSMAVHLCQNISTAALAYGQSDELSILLIDYNELETQQWFGGTVQKVVSVASSIATLHFNDCIWQHLTDYSDKLFKATFDARVFSLPCSDTINYFIWRQKDAIRNSIQSLGQANFSPKELHGKSIDDICAMLNEKDIRFEECPIVQQRGYVVKRFTESLDGNRTWTVDKDIPVFTGDGRKYIDDVTKASFPNVFSFDLP